MTSKEYHCMVRNSVVSLLIDLTPLAMRFEGLGIPKRPFPLISFNMRTSTELCKTMSDSDMGGYSSSNIEFVPVKETDPSHLRFFGSVSTDLPPDRPNL